MKLIQKFLGLFLPFAFDATNMNRVHAGTVTLWLYKSNDTAAVVNGSGYFDAYVNEIRQGDIILASCDLDGTPDYASMTVSSADNVTPVTTTTNAA